MHMNSISNVINHINMKKMMPLVMAAVLTMILILGFAAPASAADVCEMDGIPYADLADALAAVQTGETKTIKLLQDIEYNTGIVVIDKSITFEPDGFDLNVTVAEAHALEVGAGGEVWLDDSAGGELNVMNTDGYYSGLLVSGGGKATVTNVEGNHHGVNASGANTKVIVTGNVKTTRTSLGSAVVANNSAVVEVTGNAEGGYRGVWANGTDTKVIVGGNAEGFGSDSVGVNALNGSVVEVTGNVEGVNFGVYANNTNTKVTVGGDSKGLNPSSGVGVFAENGATVEVTGNVEGVDFGARAGTGATATIDGIITVPVSGTYIQVGTTTKVIGDGVPSTTKPGYIEYTDTVSTVWVRAFVCEIVETGVQYTNLADALDNVSTGQTIKLLKDIDYDKNIRINDKSVTFDVDGFILNVEPASDSALVVNGLMGGKVYLTDSNGGGEFNVICTDVSGTGVIATYGGVVQVTSVTSSGYGVYAENASTITVDGNVASDYMSVYANHTSTITVDGDVSCVYNNGVSSEHNSTVTVDGNVTGYGAGINSVFNSIVYVNGNALATNDTSNGVYAYRNVTVTVVGNVTGGSTGIYAENTSTITVGGNVTAASPAAVRGVYAEDDSRVTIDGVITVPPGCSYIVIESSVYVENDYTMPYTGSLKPAYLEYTDGSNYVWVRAFVCEIVETGV